MAAQSRVASTTCNGAFNRSANMDMLSVGNPSATPSWCGAERPRPPPAPRPRPRRHTPEGGAYPACRPRAILPDLRADRHRGRRSDGWRRPASKAAAPWRTASHRRPSGPSRVADPWKAASGRPWPAACRSRLADLRAWAGRVAVGLLHGRPLESGLGQLLAGVVNSTAVLFAAGHVGRSLAILI